MKRHLGSDIFSPPVDLVARSRARGYVWEELPVGTQSLIDNTESTLTQHRDVESTLIQCHP